jgi:hypothetical protein
VKLTAAGLLLVACGCSLALVKGPPKPVPTQGPITCDTAGGGAVGADIAIGTLTGLLIFVLGYSASKIDAHGEGDGSVGRPLALGLLVASPWYLSAYVGSSRASDCRAVKAQTQR